MKCQYGLCGKRDEATVEVERDLTNFTPTGIEGTGFEKMWTGFTCKYCLERLKSLVFKLKGGVIRFRPINTREEFKQYGYQ